MDGLGQGQIREKKDCRQYFFFVLSCNKDPSFAYLEPMIFIYI
jgi:hypothetical protein